MLKEYFVEISDDTKVYVFINTEKGKVIEFVVKLMSIYKDEWHEVLRYDSGHGCPHKDILDRNRKVKRKVWYDFLDNGQALTMAILDLKENCGFYKERYKKWLKEP
jgi:hypothetical protein